MSHDEQSSGPTNGPIDEREELLAAAEAVADGTAPKLADDDLSHEDQRVLANLERIAGLQAQFQAIDFDRTPASAGGTGSPPPSESFRWGHLQTLELIGSGSFGEVYRAFDQTLQRDVALKLRRLDRRDDTTRREYIEEARRLARVRHPNVLAVHGADVHDGRVGLWSDLISGETAEHLLARRTMKREELLALAEQLTAALEAVHATGLVHGDVKASNIMLESEGRPILMDFGAGYDLSASGGSDSRAGSPLSMAPELFEGNSPSPRSDIYALGVLLYRLSTGQYPIEAKSFNELRDAHRARAREPRGQLPQASDRVVARLTAPLLDPRPEERPTARELAGRIKDLREAPRRTRRRIAVAVVVASLAIGTTAATIGYVTSRRSEKAAIQAQHDAERATAFLTDVLASPGGTQLGVNVRVVDALELAIASAEHQLADRPVLQARVLRSIASAYHGLGRCEDAAPLYERSASRFANELGAESIAHIDALLGYARCRTLLQADADMSLERAFTLSRSHEPGSQIRTYANVYKAERRISEGDLAAGRQLLEEAIADLDPSEQTSAHRLAAIQTLSHVEVLEGNYTLARELLEEALEGTRNLYGDRDTRTLRNYRELGRVLDRMGLSHEAIMILERARAIAIELTGEDGEPTTYVTSALANNLYSVGRVEEALALNERLLELTIDRRGANSEAWLTIAVNLANQYKEVGRKTEAEALYRRCIELSATRPIGESAAFMARHNLAELLFEERRYSEAQTFAFEARARIPDLPVDHLFVLVTESLLGAIDVGLGNFSIGTQRIAEQLESARRVLGERHPNTLEIQAAHAQGLWALGQQEAALAELENTLEARRAILGEEHYRTQQSAELLAEWRQAAAAVQ